MDYVKYGMEIFFSGGAGLSGVEAAATTPVLLVALLHNIVICLLGYKLFKLHLAVVGFITGSAVGATIGAISEKAAFVFISGLIMALLFAFLAVKLYKVGLFLTVTLCSGLLLVLISGLLSGFNQGSMIIACVAALVLGILAVLFSKPIIICYTAISGGVFAGIAAAFLLQQGTTLWVVAGLVLAAIGCWVQFGLERKKTAAPVLAAPMPYAAPAPAEAAPNPPQEPQG